MAPKAKMSFKEQIEGFPIGQILITSSVRIVEPIAFTSLFPYVYFMVRDFHIAKTELEISKYVGYLASCFSLCQFVSAIQWGMVADKIGRKKVLMIGLGGSTVGMLILGFSKNYWTALGARVLMGFLNGNTGVLRTVIGENCKRKKHQGLLLSTMPFLYQIGSIMGPIIGGLLTNASDNDTTKSFINSNGFQKLNESYPYALSNIVIAIAFSVSILCCFLFLEETHYQLKYQRDYGLELGDKLKRLSGFTTPRRHWQIAGMELLTTEDSPLLEDPLSSSDEMGNSSKSDATVARQDTKKWAALLKTGVLSVIVTQALMSCHNTVYTEFLPVFMAKRTMRIGESSDFNSPLASKFPFKIVGGLGFDSIGVGKVLSGTGVCGIFVVAVLFPYIDRTFPLLKSFRCLTLLYTLIYLFIPFLIFTLPPNFPMFVTKIFVYALTFTRVVLSGTTVPFIVLFLHRASPLEHRAFINGASISFSALARFFGPFMWGNLMSFAEQREIGWLTWWSLLIFTLSSFMTSFKIKEDEEKDEDFDLTVLEQEEELLEEELVA